MTQIVCLANSIKKGGRCIAGIELSTGKWIRPIGNGPEGAIENERLINGREPQLFDVLDIPLNGLADDLGCQPENRKLARGAWKKISSWSVGEIAKYAENTAVLLHNRDKKVAVSAFANLPRNTWKSLQFIKVQQAAFFKEDSFGTLKRRCRFTYNNTTYTLPITCPSFDTYVGSTVPCYLTISLGGPFAFDGSSEQFCYKLVAGVIKL